jgi:pimeloyl-ACP methyl ester carboxylesterase
MSIFVLVHGAWHGGWCWHKVVARLERTGHTVLAPDMKGHGIDRMPPIGTTLDNLGEGIADVVSAQPEPVVLVGHSFGGTIITEVAERMPERIKRLVYLAAFVVPGGQSTRELSADDPESILGPHIVFAPGNKTATVDPEHLRACFYAHCPDDDVALARALLVPEGVAAFSSPSRNPIALGPDSERLYRVCPGSRDRHRSAAQICRFPERRETLLARHRSLAFFSSPDGLAAHLDHLA